MAPHSSRFHSCNLPVNSCAGPEHIIVTYFYLHRVVTGSLESTATTSFIVAHAFHSAYFEPRESPFPFCSSGIPFLNTCTTGAPSSSGRRRLRPVHQDRAISSTFLSDKSIRFKQLYIQIFEFRPLEFLKKLSPSPSYRFPCSQLAAPSEHSEQVLKGGGDAFLEF